MFKNPYRHIIIYTFIINVILSCVNYCFASMKTEEDLHCKINNIYLIKLKDNVLNYKVSDSNNFQFSKMTSIFSTNSYVLKPLAKDKKAMLFIKTKNNNFIFNIDSNSKNQTFTDINSDLYQVTKIDEPPKR